jgi:vacuolar-type H+-ATPase subunit H
MCHFVSWVWVRPEDKIYFLKNSDIKEALKLGVSPDDLSGHGAIRLFYSLKNLGTNFECTKISSPSNFPDEIIKSIKKGEMSSLGRPLEILNKKGREKYNKIVNPAREKYNKIIESAGEKYDKIVNPAREKYNKIKGHTYSKIVSKKENRVKEWK